jgi:hypothetical protein
MSAQSDRIRRQLAQVVANVKTELATRLLTKLRDRTPVRTGYTQSRWTTVVDGTAINVTNDEGEAVMRINDGHSRQRPAGFIEQAIDETISEMQREVRPAKP